MKRCVEACPDLTNGKGIEALSIIRHGVGLRPMRDDGPRVEKEKVDGTWIIHSYGTADMAVKLVEDALRDKARL